MALLDSFGNPVSTGPVAGYFISLSALNSTIPAAWLYSGYKAYIGASAPFAEYVFKHSAWTATQTTIPNPPAVSIPLYSSDIISDVTQGGDAKVLSATSQKRTPIASSAISADTAPNTPGTYPNCTVFYIADSLTSGIDAGTEVIWIPTNDSVYPASRGWRFAFYPSATVL